MVDVIEECKVFVEWFGVLVVNSYLYNDLFLVNYLLWCGLFGYQGLKVVMKLLLCVDVVIVFGLCFGLFGMLLQYGMDYWLKDVKIIQIDVDYKMFGFVKKILVGICGDVKVVVVVFVQCFDGCMFVCDGLCGECVDQIVIEKVVWEKEFDDWMYECDVYSFDMIEEQKNEKIFNGGCYLYLCQVLCEFEKVMFEDVMVLIDIGNINLVVNSYLCFNKLCSFFVVMSWGNCGYVFLMIIGVKVVVLYCLVVLYVGDGVWGMSLMEMMICVCYNILVMVVVFYNC